MKRAFTYDDMIAAYNRGTTAILDGNGHGEEAEEYMERVFKEEENLCLYCSTEMHGTGHHGHCELCTGRGL